MTKPGREDYPDEDSYKMIIEVGGNNATELVDVLTKVILELGKQYYVDTKEDTLPTMPIGMYAFKGITPGWQAMRKDMDSIEKDPEFMKRQEQQAKDMMGDGSASVTVKRTKRKKSEDDSSDRGMQSFLDNL